MSTKPNPNPAGPSAGDPPPDASAADEAAKAAPTAAKATKPADDVPHYLVLEPFTVNDKAYGKNQRIPVAEAKKWPEGSAKRRVENGFIELVA